MSTTARSQELAAQFTALNDASLATIAGCTDAGWRRITASEGWTVAAAAHHFASVQQGFVGLVTTLANGETYSPAPAMGDIDQDNARHAEEYAAADRAETLTLLRTSGAAITKLLGGLDDAGIARIAGTFGGRELTVAQVIEYVVIGHARYHLASIRETLAA